MLKILKSLFSDKSLTKIAGIYNSQQQAQKAAEEMIGNSRMNGYRVEILHPYEGVIGDITESENIFESLSHVTLGAAGGFVGLTIYAILFWSNNPSIMSTPIASLMHLIGFGITVGLLLKSFFSIKPEHSRLIAKVREQLEEGKYAVIVHPIDDSDTQRAIESVKRSTYVSIRTF